MSLSDPSYLDFFQFIFQVSCSVLPLSLNFPFRSPSFPSVLLWNPFLVSPSTGPRQDLSITFFSCLP
jgi:hypothetical protein